MMGTMISRHQAGVEYQKQRAVCVGSVLHKEDEMLLLMCYDAACFMHLTPGVIHNFPKAVGV